MAEESGLLRAYKDLITSQHRGKPKYMDTVTDLLRYSDDIYATAVYMDEEFDLDLAIGAQEDVLGRLVGADRELGFQPHTQDTATLNDEDYRILLKAKIAKNLWKGGIGDLQRIWRTLFDQDIVVIDNQDMTIEVQIRNVPSSVVHEMILQGYIVPKPQSVGMNYHIIRELDSQYYIGGAPSKSLKTVIRMKYADGGSIDATVYYGGAPSRHGRTQIRQEYAKGGAADSTHYYGGAASRHTGAQIRQEYSKGGTADSTHCYGGAPSRHTRAGIRQEYAKGGIASSLHCYGGAPSQHKRFEIPQTKLNIANNTHYYAGVFSSHTRVEICQTELNVANNTRYFGAVPSRHSRAQVIQECAKDGIAASLHYYGGALSQHRRVEIR